MKDTRCWRYRKGEAKLFASEADVPKGEGWVDSPAKAAQKEDPRAAQPTPEERQEAERKAAEGDPDAAPAHRAFRPADPLVRRRGRPPRVQ